MQVRDLNYFKGGEFVRYVRALAVGGSAIAALRELAEQHGEGAPLTVIAKAAVSPGTIGPGGWGAPLGAYRVAGDDFLEFVRPQTLLGKLAGLRAVPAQTRVPAVTAGGSAYWIGENDLIPVSRISLAPLELPVRKLATMTAITRELARTSSPSADRIIRADLAAAVIQATDETFVDDVAGDDSRPAGIRNGVSPLVAYGAIEQDIDRLIDVFDGDLERAFLVMHPRLASSLNSQRHPGIGARGGEFIGIPVVVTKALSVDSSGGTILLVDPTRIAVADEGIAIEASEHADIQLDDAPIGTAGAVLTSTFQNNLIALRTIRYLNWVAAAGAVAVLNGVAPGGES